MGGLAVPLEEGWRRGKHAKRRTTLRVRSGAIHLIDLRLQAGENK